MRPVRMTLVEKEMDVPVGPDGAFAIRGLAEGTYTLEVSVAGGPPSRRKLEVPAREYDLDLQ
jgi:hypothetical protein